jgi:hypothetical protein
MQIKNKMPDWLTQKFEFDRVPNKKGMVYVQNNEVESRFNFFNYNKILQKSLIR